MATDYLSPETIARGALGMTTDYVDEYDTNKAREVLTNAGLLGSGQSNNNSKTSLVPTATNKLYIQPFVPTVKVPEYTAPERQEFDWTTPDSEKPSGTEDWHWTRNIKAKQLFDQEQDAKEQSAYNKYLSDLGIAQNALDLEREDWQNQQKQVSDYFTSQGLIAPVAGDPTAAIRYLRQVYQDATARGNFVTAAQAHDQAEALRQQAWGTSGGADGSLTDYLMTSAGLPSQEGQRNAANLEYIKSQITENLAQAAKANSGSSGTSLAGSGAAAANPFQNANNAESSSSDNLYGYPISRIDNKITELRNRFKTPDAVLEYVQTTKTYAPNFQKALLQRLQSMVV